MSDSFIPLGLFFCGLLGGFAVERASRGFFRNSNASQNASSQRESVGDDGKVLGKEPSQGDSGQKTGTQKLEREIFACDIGKLGGGNVKPVALKVEPLGLCLGALFSYALLSGRVVRHDGLPESTEQLKVRVSGGGGDGGDGLVVHMVSEKVGA